MLKQRHFEELEKFQRQAFQLLCPDGYIEEKQIVEALLHGTKKNSDFLERETRNVQCLRAPLILL